MPETTAPYSRRELLKFSDELEERAERFGELTAERKEAVFRQLDAGDGIHRILLLRCPRGREPPDPDPDPPPLAGLPEGGC